MKLRLNLALAAALLLGSSIAALAGDVRTDYDHTANFSQYHTYSWGQVKTTNPFYVARIQQAVNAQLQAKGWQLVPSNGSVTVFAFDNVQNQQQVQTQYNDWGGGWGGGWGWGGWGWGGMGMPGGFDATATTTTTNQPVGNLVIDLFEGTSKNLLWRGLATEDLSTNSNKNTSMLDNDIKNMFKSFPAKPTK
jgi:Domain of unknown function (DUF4136)